MVPHKFSLPDLFNPQTTYIHTSLSNVLSPNQGPNTVDGSFCMVVAETCGHCSHLALPVTPKYVPSEIGRLILSPSSWPLGLVSSKSSVSEFPFLVLHMVLYTLLGRGCGPLYLRSSLPSLRLLSAFHSHSYVPWWSFLDPAPSINWRRRTPAHQDGSHSESRTLRAASVETLPIPCLSNPCYPGNSFPAGVSFS